ncbi:MAG: T9SS type A sorting domain-containing protein, partial [Bacteroidota bacterium]
ENYCNGLVTGLQSEFQEFDFSLYPNPASHYFTILHNQKELDIELYNSLGQKVASGNTTQNTFDIQKLANGLYIVLLKTNNRIIGSTRLMKIGKN